MITNQETYKTKDFNYWAYKENLDSREKYLIEKYLDKSGTTLEAGTAGGRILLEMQNLGFESLYGFDYITNLIEQAKKRDTSHLINFTVQDAKELNYQDSSFDQIIYLQQIICCLENGLDRLKGIKEAYRILKPGGIALFSFLSFEARFKSFFYSMYLNYIKLLRTISKSNLSPQSLSRLKLDGKPQISSLLDRGPFMYWYKLPEAYESLHSVGFKVISMGSSHQIKQQRMCLSLQDLQKDLLEGQLFIVCQK